MQKLGSQHERIRSLHEEVGEPNECIYRWDEVCTTPRPITDYFEIIACESHVFNYEFI